jgi:hypothetical protein
MTFLYSITQAYDLKWFLVGQLLLPWGILTPIPYLPKCGLVSQESVIVDYLHMCIVYQIAPILLNLIC